MSSGMLRAVIVSLVAVIVSVPVALNLEGVGAQEPPQTPQVCIEPGEIHTFEPLLTTFVFTGIGYETVLVIENTGSNLALVGVVMDDFGVVDIFVPTSAVTLQTLIGAGETKEFALHEYVAPDVRVGIMTIEASQPICAYLRFDRSLLVTLDSLRTDLTSDIDTGVLPRSASPLPKFVAIADRLVRKGNFQQAMFMFEQFERHMQKLIASQQVAPNIGVPYLERVSVVMDMMGAGRDIKQQ